MFILSILYLLNYVVPIDICSYYIYVFIMFINISYYIFWAPLLFMPSLLLHFIIREREEMSYYYYYYYYYPSIIIVLSCPLLLF